MLGRVVCTKLPGKLDSTFGKLDLEGALRATKIMPADRWTKKSQKALLGSPVEASLYKSEQETERDRAFDLLVRTSAHSRADPVACNVVV